MKLRYRTLLTCAVGLFLLWPIASSSAQSLPPHAAGRRGQRTMPPVERHDRIKVPATPHASYAGPESPPVFDMAEPTPKQRSRRPSAVQRAAHHQPIPQGGIVMEETSPGVETFDYGTGPGPVPGGCSGCSAGCDSCCMPCPDPCHTIWENLQIFGGVEGFKSPVDQGLNGNFGFHEGLNWGGPVFEYGGLGGQVGGQVVQSNLAESLLYEDNRIQYFLTAGLFHRPFDNNGWQGGVVWDWLHDDFYIQADVSQIRAELSWLSHGCHEIGFWTAIGTTSDTAYSSLHDEEVTWTPIDMYALFYRKHFENGAIGRFSAGFTGDGQGLLGADVLAPLSQRCALVANANYIIGRNDPAPEESLTESWGLTISLVIYPGYKTPCSSRNPYRPMFGVADNTTMMLNYNGPPAN